MGDSYYLDYIPAKGKGQKAMVQIMHAAQRVGVPMPEKQALEELRQLEALQLRCFKCRKRAQKRAQKGEGKR